MSNSSTSSSGALIRCVVDISAVAIALICSACAGGERPSPFDLRIDDFAVIVSPESELLGMPVELDVHESGNLFVLDGPAARIFTLSHSGEVLNTLGNQGSGPHEFQHPTTFTLDGDTIRVVDRGNFRLQVLALDSHYQRSPRLPEGAMYGPVALRADGSMIIATSGMGDALAIFYDASGNQVGTYGDLVAPINTTDGENAPIGILDPRAMKAELLAGMVPAFLQNAALPVFDPSGDVWLVLKGQREIQRYSEDGTLLESVSVAAPEYDTIWSACVEDARETLDDPRRIPQLAYVADAEVIGSKLWLLLNMPEGDPAVMLKLSTGGEVEGRVEFTNVHGVQRFALDNTETRVYFAVPSAASLVAAAVPEGVF